MRELKVFGTTLSSHPDDDMATHFPGDVRVSQVRAVVAAKTKKRAAELLGMTLGEFNTYSNETGNETELKVALGKPEQVFAKPSSNWGDRYVEISRRPHVPIPRPKRTTIHRTFDVTFRDEDGGKAAAPQFSQDELEAIMERFAMANDPVGQSIAEKARKMLS